MDLLLIVKNIEKTPPSFHQ